MSVPLHYVVPVCKSCYNAGSYIDKIPGYYVPANVTICTACEHQIKSTSYYVMSDNFGPMKKPHYGQPNTEDKSRCIIL